MGERVRLFDYVHVDLPKSGQGGAAAHPAFVSDTYESAEYLTPEYKNFSGLLPKIEHGKSYDFVSFGQWNLKTVVFHLLKLIGPAAVYSTTYGLGPTAARAIVQGLDSGLIQDFTFVYDSKVKTYKEEAHNLCESRFKVKVTSIHAKITVLMNNNFGLLITGSANWSDKNAKIELTTVSVDRDRALFYKNLIANMADASASEPKLMYNELLSKRFG